MMSRPDSGTTPRTVGSRADRAIWLAGCLVIVGIVGSVAMDWLWWALSLAAAALAIGLLKSPSFAASGSSRAAAIATAGLVLALLLATATGLLINVGLGYEPPWLATLTTIVAFGFAGSLVWLAVSMLKSRRLTLLTGIVLGSALPAGAAFDWVLGQYLPPGFFLTGAGFYVGLTLLGYAFIRLGRIGRRPAPAPADSRGTRARPYTGHTT